MYSSLYHPPPNAAHNMDFPPPGAPQYMHTLPSSLGHLMPIGPGGVPFPFGALPPNMPNAYPMPMAQAPPPPHQPQSHAQPHPHHLTSPPSASVTPIPASLPPPPPLSQSHAHAPPLGTPGSLPFLDLTMPPLKRGFEDDEDAEGEEVVEAISLDEPFKWNCNQVRSRIRNWIDNGGMKVTEFQKAIGVNSNAYRNFMAQNGPYKGVNSSVYSAAYFFFREMEVRGEKIPRKKIKTDSSSPATSTKSTPRSRGKAALTDFGDIRLEGEDDGEVKIYDTCDEVRKKINAYLQTPGITQASFLKDIAAQVGEGINIQGKQLTDFRTKKGPDAGNTSRVYYGSYLFFEKLRIRDGKPKSKHRLEMEKIWKNGMDRTTANKGIWLHTSEYATKDKYGQFHIHKR